MEQHVWNSCSCFVLQTFIQQTKTRSAGEAKYCACDGRAGICEVATYKLNTVRTSGCICSYAVLLVAALNPLTSVTLETPADENGDRKTVKTSKASQKEETCVSRKKRGSSGAGSADRNLLAKNRKRNVCVYRNDVPQLKGLPSHDKTACSDLCRRPLPLHCPHTHPLHNGGAGGLPAVTLVTMKRKR